MRRVGSPRILSVARRFYHYLLEKKIESSLQMSESLDGLWQIWVIDEDNIEEASKYWKRFEKSPSLIPEVDEKAGNITSHHFPQFAKASDDLGFERTWRSKSPFNRVGLLGPLIAVICSFLFISINTSMINTLRNRQSPIEFLAFEDGDQNSRWSGYCSHWFQKKGENREQLALKKRVSFFAQIRKGELWRLITPSLLHANLCQMIFNLAWLMLFAKQIERRDGAKKLCLVLLLSSCGANVAEFLAFGNCTAGIIGPVSAIFAFCAVKRCHFPWEDYRISTNALVFFALWLFIDSALQLGMLIGSVTGHFSRSLSATVASQICGLFIGYGLARVPSSSLKLWPIWRRF